MDLLTLFFIALVVLALVWFSYGRKSKDTLPTSSDKVEGEGELDEVGEDISEAN